MVKKRESSGLTAMAHDIGEINLYRDIGSRVSLDGQGTDFAGFIPDYQAWLAGLPSSVTMARETASPATHGKRVSLKLWGIGSQTKRKAGTKGTDSHPEKRFETTLAESQFSNLELAEIITARTWTIDGIIGYLYSTSFLISIPVLADKKDPFEKD